MALQYITKYLLPALEEANNGTFARVQKYIIENSAENFDPSNCPSPSPSLTSSSLCDCFNCINNYTDDEEEGSYTSSTHHHLSVSQQSIASRLSSPSTLNSDEDEDEFKESPPSKPSTLPSNLLVVPSELKKYMDRYPEVSNLVQNSIDLITTECTDLEKYVKSDFGIFALMKEVLSSSPENSRLLSDQNLGIFYEMTEILKEKISEMESATENLKNTEETFQNILGTLNSSSS